MAIKTQRILPDLQAEQAARIAELEAQLEAAKGKATETSIEIQDYKGKPVLYFQGPFRPFHMGQAKCKVMLANVRAIENFVKTGGKKI